MAQTRPKTHSPPHQDIPGKQEEIWKRIAPIAHSMSDADGVHSPPDLTRNSQKGSRASRVQEIEVWALEVGEAEM